MFNRIFIFSKNIGVLLRQSKHQLYALISLFKSLAPYDLKSASSILFFSSESLASVLRYKGSGKKTANLIDARERVVGSGKILFILGSGPSVNDHTPTEWEYIRKNDSWGFNLWFCNDFVPSAYVAQALIEPEDNKEESRPYKSNKMLSKMLQDKQEEYGNVEFYIRGDAVNRYKFYDTELGKSIEQIVGRQGELFAEMPVSSTNKISPDILLEKIFEKGFYQVDREIQVIPKIGSTITELISFGLMLGYKEIVLCGIDMNDGGHFYDDEETFSRYPLLRELSNFNHTRTPGGGHEHMDTSTRPFTIKEYIIALRKLAQTKFDADVYVMRKESALYPEIPKYEKYDV